MQRTVCVMAVAMVLWASMDRASAEDMRAGLEHLRAGDLAAARAAFAHEYAETRDPEALRYLGDAHRAGGDFDRAAVYYRRYLSEADANARPRARVTRYLEMIERSQRIGAIAPGSAARATPPPAVAGPLAAAAPSVDPRAPDRRRFWIAATATGVGAIAFTYAGYRTYGFEEAKQAQFETWLRAEEPELNAPLTPGGDLRDVCDASRDYASTSAYAQQLSDTCAAGRRWARTANWAAVGTGLAAGVTAYYAYRAFWQPPAPRESLRVEPVVSPDQLGASVSLHF